MNKKRYVCLQWIAVVLLALAFGCLLLCQKPEEGVAVCECAVTARAGTKIGFGNYHSVRSSAEWLLDVARDGGFKTKLIERCVSDLQAERRPDVCHAVSNVVAAIAFDVLSKHDDEWRFSITAKSANRRLAVAVVNICYDAMNECLESENRKMLEKSVSQTFAKKVKLERRLSDLLSEIDLSPNIPSGGDNPLALEVRKLQEELKSLASDESHIKSNCLANSDVVLLLKRAD